jgi:hypothetical protein
LPSRKHESDVLCDVISPLLMRDLWKSGVPSAPK